LGSKRFDREWPFFAAVVLLILFADIVSKYLVSAGVWTGDYLGGWLRITLVNNPGAAFGLFPGARVSFIVITLIAPVVFLGSWGRGRLRGLALTLPLAMIFAGALGNLLDRLRATGEVIDFIDFGFGPRRWYVFNIADACISVGALLLVFSLTRRPQALPRPE
jgi:signal peptidase II